MAKRLLTYFFLLLQTVFVQAQLSNSLPAYFHDFYVDPSIGNTAIFDLETKSEINIHYKSFLGPLSEIQILNGNVYFIKDKKQRFGLRFQSDQEGEFFQRNRANLVYGINIPLFKSWSMNASTYLGGIFYSFKSSGNFQGGQDQSLDLGVGLSLNNKKFTIGFSGNQLNEAILRPLLFQFKIERFYEFYVSKQFSLSNKWNITTSGKYRIALNPIDRLAHVLVLFSPENESFTFGTHYLYNLGFSPTFGMKIPYNQSKNGFLGINMSFFMPVNNHNRNTFIKNQYEISLKWTLY